MEIRADTNDENKVPKVGDIFIVTEVNKVSAFWIIKLKKE